MNLQIYEEASDWVIRHRDGQLNPEEKQSFDAWLRESPQHVRAYLEMSSVWEDLPSLDPTSNPSADELIASVRANSSNVVAFSSPTSSASAYRSGAETPDDHTCDAREKGHERAEGCAVRGEANTPASLRLSNARGASTKRKVRALAAVAASVLIAFVGSWSYLQRGVYATDIGEQRSLALNDGSTVELNSRSRIKVRYTDRERRIDLLDGQALFQVAKNASRPFVVQSNGTRVRAVGTAFDVYKANAGTVVTVVEGRVAIHAAERRLRPVGAGELPEIDGGPGGSVLPGSGTAKPEETGVTDADRSGSATPPKMSDIRLGVGEILLAAGEQLMVTATTVTPPKLTNVAAATAWTRRSLVFDSSPLTEVAQEFNRYNARRLVIDDPQLADFHVSGVFSSVEPTLLIRFLRTQPELVVEETGTEIRITRK